MKFWRPVAEPSMQSKRIPVPSAFVVLLWMMLAVILGVDAHKSVSNAIDVCGTLVIFALALCLVIGREARPASKAGVRTYAAWMVLTLASADVMLAIAMLVKSR